MVVDNTCHSADLKIKEELNVHSEKHRKTSSQGFRLLSASDNNCKLCLLSGNIEGNGMDKRPLTVSEKLLGHPSPCHFIIC